VLPRLGILAIAGFEIRLPLVRLESFHQSIIRLMKNLLLLGTLSFTIAFSCGLQTQKPGFFSANHSYLCFPEKKPGFFASEGTNYPRSFLSANASATKPSHISNKKG